MPVFQSLEAFWPGLQVKDPGAFLDVECLIKVL